MDPNDFFKSIPPQDQFFENPQFYENLSKSATKLVLKYQFQEFQKDSRRFISSNFFNDFSISINNEPADFNLDNVVITKNNLPSEIESNSGVSEKTHNNQENSLKSLAFEKLIIYKFLERKGKEIKFKARLIKNFKNIETELFLSFSEIEEVKKCQVFTRENFEENCLFFPKKGDDPFADLYCYQKNEKILFCIQIATNLENHKKTDYLFFNSNEYGELKNKEGIGKVVYVWIIDGYDEGKILKRFGMNLEETLVVDARENSYVWKLY